jgi:hypothetical protein
VQGEIQPEFEMIDVRVACNVNVISADTAGHIGKQIILGEKLQRY